MKKGVLVPALLEGARLKRRIRQHLKKLGFERQDDGSLAPPSGAKEVLRGMHAPQRAARLTQNRSFIEDNKKLLLSALADGSEIAPEKIALELRRIRKETRESDLFRLASLTWSVPVSNGFGRRLRYLVWDKYHDRLAGLIALGDPVFNLGVRDRLIGWSAQDRAKRLANVLDAYVLGAVPPYSNLLGGKAVASVVRTREIYDDFLAEYGAIPGVISGKNKRARLLLVTTSSSLGRSSIYNRIKLDGRPYFNSIGFTEGWGHFHISDDLFLDLREFLRQSAHPYADENRYGQGPNWRLRTIREALKILGLSEDVLHHGLKREVFACEFASNALSILRAGRGQPDLTSLKSTREVSALAVSRWMLPRSLRDNSYANFRKIDFLNQLLNDQGPSHADRASLG
ncbi:Druantia anti-phage system protein DruA [Bradyrhizobium guangdongense]|uniref:Druantia anti-phage system protein DruA n=1 Tax=Bradyrhizobium guangdongense TaxID=1325090 RepID=UPI00131A13C5|nr:Druantia anti-phage system protein DruA [Bradyrhizobium guangdongense]